jgi:hypothetical protein
VSGWATERRSQRLRLHADRAPSDLSFSRPITRLRAFIAGF